jgi:glycosyltransferase involved in cell wall biosynthesis
MATILTCYYRPKPGGLFARYLRAIEALLAAGHRIHYLSLTPFPIEHPHCVFHRFPWPVAHSERLLFWTFFHFLAPIHLTYLAIRYRVDQAFCFDPVYALPLQPLRILGVLVATCFLRGDAVVSLHCQKRPDWLIRLFSLLEGMALHGIRIVGFGTHWTRAILNRHPNIVPQAIFELPNDMPVPVYQGDSSRQGPLRMAMVGFFTCQKNHDYILKLLSEMRHHIFQLSIFGQGTESSMLKNTIIAGGLEERVSLCGWVSGPDIWPQVDLLLMPSLHEGMPNAILEALASGIPILASDIPGHRIMLPKKYCLPLKNPGLWSKTLKAIIDDPEARLRAMQKDQQEFAGRLQFDWNARVVDMIVLPDHKRHNSL